jgi:hypothetical protein
VIKCSTFVTERLFSCASLLDLLARNSRFTYKLPTVH